MPFDNTVDIFGIHLSCSMHRLRSFSDLPVDQSKFEKRTQPHCCLLWRSLKSRRYL